MKKEFWRKICLNFSSPYGATPSVHRCSTSVSKKALGLDSTYSTIFLTRYCGSPQPVDIKILSPAWIWQKISSRLENFSGCFSLTASSGLMIPHTPSRSNFISRGLMWQQIQRCLQMNRRAEAKTVKNHNSLLAGNKLFRWNN